MNTITAKMREIARDLLERKEVKRVIGWEKGIFPYQSTPFFAETPADANKLIWDEFCLNNLAVYLLDFRNGEDKVALFVKGCDSRGVVRLIQDQQFPRERVYLIGIPCPGLKDSAAFATLPAGTEIPVADKCRACTYKNPVLYDVLISPLEASEKMEGDPLAGVKELEALDLEARFKFWQSHYERCIRCYACRNICPACNCRECIFDQTTKEWLTKEVNGANNQFFGMIRDFHIAGRCINCGECERICPVEIPIMRLNRKVIKDINELFGEYEAGADLEKMPPLGLYSADDPEEFM